MGMRDYSPKEWDFLPAPVLLLVLVLVLVLFDLRSYTRIVARSRARPHPQPFSQSWEKGVPERINTPHYYFSDVVLVLEQIDYFIPAVLGAEKW